MRSARVAEWILSQVLPPERAVSTVGDWMEDKAERGGLWFWSSVFRTVLSRVWSDFAESPGFMVGLALRGWLYEFWLIACISVGLISILVPVVLLSGYLARQLHWHPSWPDHASKQVLIALGGQVSAGWCQFQAGRWIARRAPGKELAAGVAACLTPMALFFLVGLVSMHFLASEINGFIASHPDNSVSVQTSLPSGIFLLAGIFWSRHKSIRNVVQ
jgi:hypothetical protein